MSWHGRWGKKDPFKREIVIGETLGTWSVLKEVQSDAHYGSRVRVRCNFCMAERVMVLTQLRYSAKNGEAKTHRGCTRGSKR